VFVRKVRTASGAVAVQVMRKAGGCDVLVEHVGSAHTDAELGVLLEQARRVLADLGAKAVLYRTIQRRLGQIGPGRYHDLIATECFAHAGDTGGLRRAWSCTTSPRCYADVGITKRSA
jgi:hypothetical protein